MIVFYLIVLAGILFLMVVARKQPLLWEKRKSVLWIPVRRSAVFLYRKIFLPHGGKHCLEGSLAERDKVQRDFALLDPSAGIGKKVTLYYIEKLQKLLEFVIAADVLAIMVWVNGRGQTLLNGEAVQRPDYGETAIEIQAKAIDADDGELSYGEYTVYIGAREYTLSELETMAKELLQKLPDLILGDNLNLLHVTENLNFPEEVEGYPFEISWKSSAYAWVGPDGTVNTEQLEDGESQEVELTVSLSCQDYTCEEVISVVLFAQELTKEEQLEEKIREALEESDANSIEEEWFFLPSVIDGISLQWKETREDSSTLLFALILIAGAAVFVLKDLDLHHQVELRERQMALDYPQIVSKLVLFLGAGMSVRNAFERIAESYQEDRRKGGEKHYVYEEILLVCRELNSGISESTAYANLGIRCRTRQYTKLCSLLTQNLKKGNQTLLQALQEEAGVAFEERKRLARQMGEEAGTRMLLPMIMMLGVTLVIIMIPAFLSFSF